MPYFELSWKSHDRSWNYHGKIMEFYFIFSVGTLSVFDELLTEVVSWLSFHNCGASSEFVSSSIPS